MSDKYYAKKKKKQERREECQRCNFNDCTGKISLRRVTFVKRDGGKEGWIDNIAERRNIHPKCI